MDAEWPSHGILPSDTITDVSKVSSLIVEAQRSNNAMSMFGRLRGQFETQSSGSLGHGLTTRRRTHSPANRAIDTQPYRKKYVEYAEPLS